MVQNQAPKQMTYEEMGLQLEQNLAQVRQTVAQVKANYANSYLTLASKVAEALVVETKDVEGSINTAFSFMEAFRLRALQEDNALKEAAPIDETLYNQEQGILGNLAFLHEEVKRLQAEMDAKATQASNEKVVELIQPTAQTEVQPEAV